VRLVIVLYSTLPLFWFVGTGRLWALLLTLLMLHWGFRPFKKKDGPWKSWTRNLQA
jgi:hypothetical protein